MQNTTDNQILDWSKPLTFTHMLDSKEPAEKAIRGMILTGLILIGLILMAAVILGITYAKNRCTSKHRLTYGRLYEENIVSIQGIKEKV